MVSMCVADPVQKFFGSRRGSFSCGFQMLRRLECRESVQLLENFCHGSGRASWKRSKVVGSSHLGIDGGEKKIHDCGAGSKVGLRRFCDFVCWFREFQTGEDRLAAVKPGLFIEINTHPAEPGRVGE